LQRHTDAVDIVYITHRIKQDGINAMLDCDGATEH
jgi:hypothetical protein